MLAFGAFGDEGRARGEAPGFEVSAELNSLCGRERRKEGMSVEKMVDQTVTHEAFETLGDERELLGCGSERSAAEDYDMAGRAGGDRGCARGRRKQGHFADDGAFGERCEVLVRVGHIESSAGEHEERITRVSLTKESLSGAQRAGCDRVENPFEGVDGEVRQERDG